MKNYGGIRIDDKASRVLEYLWTEQSTATTRDLTSDTVLDKDAVRYRFQKLEKADLVETTLVETSEYTVTQATITEKGENAIRKGRLGDFGKIELEVDEATSERKANKQRSRQNQEDIAALQDEIEEHSRIIAAILLESELDEDTVIERAKELK